MPGHRWNLLVDTRGVEVAGVRLAGCARDVFDVAHIPVLPRFREDAWMFEPHRLGVLVKYGEGPHMSALALIPIALAFTWLALEKRRPWAIALAALFSAGVAANNFYGAAALGVFYPILVWSLWITRQEKRIVVPPSPFRSSLTG